VRNFADVDALPDAWGGGGVSCFAGRLSRENHRRRTILIRIVSIVRIPQTIRGVVSCQEA
jgi:hypothetical protein